ncbi:hypothetical protein GH5_04730 [Leishmania sp. Ghana 2012 LV757]|uniref:hypothetical protein n=1 Tax=Leishmania sp. Ghana 2012 LV757 TaxID=2803181 RepID=UPI001B61AD81|nr:hypothetical protein GH5_04730 [Leishmania sp. Ghana 2012 LV757]
MRARWCLSLRHVCLLCQTRPCVYTTTLPSLAIYTFTHISSPSLSRTSCSSMGTCKTDIKKVKDVAEATALVLDWFQRHNKPVTPQSLTDALGSRVAKPLVQKILEQLHAEETLYAKDMKKIRFYYLRVLPLPDPSSATTTEPNGETEEKAVATADKGGAVTSAPHVGGGSEACGESPADVHAALLHAVVTTAVQLSQRSHRLARWRGCPSSAERAAKSADLARDVGELRESLERHQSRYAGEPTEAHGASSWVWRARRAVCRYRRARRHWLQRKEWAMCLLEATAGDAHTPVQVAALLGCTTDVEVGVSFEETAVALPAPLLRELRLSPR